MKNKIIDRFVCTLKKEFLDFGELSVEIIIKGQIGLESGDNFSTIVSRVSLEYSGETIFFSPLTKKFYYEGETSLGSFSEITSFVLLEENLVRLPKGLIDALIRVAENKIAERFYLEEDKQMLDF